MRRALALAGTMAMMAAVGGPAGAHNEGIPSVPLDRQNLTHIQNIPNVSGNALDFFARRQADGTVKHYAVVAHMGWGFDILEVDDPGHPKVVGRYTGPDTANPANTLNYGYGVNVHPWVSVNPRRNIVALTIEDQPVRGAAPRHNLVGVGIQFVDISDVTNPKPLGQVTPVDGPHTVRMIGDTCAYTSLNTWIVDYTDPQNPTAQRKGGQFEGHEFWEDANRPGLVYFGRAGTFGFGVLDVENCRDPKIVGTLFGDPSVSGGASHEVYPAPDSSFVGVADFKSGQSTVACPGGGIHFYDVSGRYVQGASQQAPRKMGQWFAPFSGVSSNPSATQPNYASCTMHSWQPQPERTMGVVGLYAGGTWVLDFSAPTQAGGAYTEFDGGDRGKTTWANTTGNVRDALDYVNAAQWLPFDLANPQHERYIFVNGSERGLDVYRYDGPLPKKMSRLTVEGSAPAGVLTGKLERYAMLGPDGWRNTPLGGRTVTISVNGVETTARTADDGGFAADLELSAGSHQVTVTWAGDAIFRQETVTRTVTVA